MTELSGRQLEAACLLADGLDDNAIAKRMGVSVSTVIWHLRRAYRKTGTGSRAGLAEWVRTGTAAGRQHQKPRETAVALRPRVLAHLDAYPSLSFSVREVARAIAADETSVRKRLRELEADGKAVSATGPRAPGDTDKVTTWRAAREDGELR